jgi:hypothetical protein
MKVSRGPAAIICILEEAARKNTVCDEGKRGLGLRVNQWERSKINWILNVAIFWDIVPCCPYVN